MIHQINTFHWFTSPQIRIHRWTWRDTPLQKRHQHYWSVINWPFLTSIDDVIFDTNAPNCSNDGSNWPHNWLVNNENDEWPTKPSKWVVILFSLHVMQYEARRSSFLIVFSLSADGWLLTMHPSSSYLRLLSFRFLEH